MAQRFDLAKQSNAHRPSGLRERGSGHKTVAAIIAWTAQDTDCPGGKAPLDLAGNRLARILHQQIARYAGRRRQAVCRGCLLDRK